MVWSYWYAGGASREYESNVGGVGRSLDFHKTWKHGSFYFIKKQAESEHYDPQNCIFLVPWGTEFNS